MHCTHAFSAGAPPASRVLPACRQRRNALVALSTCLQTASTTLASADQTGQQQQQEQQQEQQQGQQTGQQQQPDATAPPPPPPPTAGGFSLYSWLTWGSGGSAAASPAAATSSLDRECQEAAADFGDGMAADMRVQVPGEQRRSWYRLSRGSTTPSSAEAAQQAIQRQQQVPVPVDHPALQLLRQRALASSTPGARRDPFKLGLVVEGGGMRGCVSGGALQALADLGLRDIFDAVYGSSAGAINSTYFLTGAAGWAGEWVSGVWGVCQCDHALFAFCDCGGRPALSRLPVWLFSHLRLPSLLPRAPQASGLAWRSTTTTSPAPSSSASSGCGRGRGWPPCWTSGSWSTTSCTACTPWTGTQRWPRL